MMCSLGVLLGRFPGVIMKEFLKNSVLILIVVGLVYIPIHNTQEFLLPLLVLFLQWIESILICCLPFPLRSPYCPCQPAFFLGKNLFSTFMDFCFALYSDSSIFCQGHICDNDGFGTLHCSLVCSPIDSHRKTMTFLLSDSFRSQESITQCR